MQPARQSNAPELRWLETSPGQALLRAEAGLLRHALDSIFGDEMLQIGAWGADLFPAFSRTRRCSVATAVVTPQTSFVTCLDDLSVVTDSIDTVLLSHALETCPDPHGLLREVDRILRPDGHLLVLGFNPHGFWGLRHLLSRRRFPPGAAHLISERRLSDWLRLLGYAMHSTDFCHYQLPVFAGSFPEVAVDTELPAASASPRQQPAGFPVRALNRVRSWPPFAACYLLVARKQTYTVTPMRPVWRARRRLVGGLVNPTTRNAA